MPIPFSNLGMIIPEVFLPWQTPQTEEEGHYSVETSEGYKGRVTLEFLTALQINAEQLQRYLKTYIKHSDDFPSNVYVSLQTKLAHAQKLHSDVKAHLDSSQAELTEAASAYVEYMREVKAMCRNVWAKFDNFHITQGIILFALTVFMNILTLFNTDLSLRCLRKSLPIASVLGVLISLVTLVVSPLPLEMGVGSIMDVILSLSFCPLILFLIIHSTLFIYKILVGKSLTDLLYSVLDHLSFTYVFCTLVAVSCSVSLVSNSFILYEGDMTIFFIQSVLICFLVQRTKSLGGQYTVLQTSNSKEGTRIQNGIQKASLSLTSILKASCPLLLAMILVRLTKLFHACRDLQVGCEATSFIQPYHGAVESLGKFADLRLFFSCFGVVCVPLSLAVLVSSGGNFHHLSRWLVLCVYTALPLSSLCMCGFWFLQSLPQSTLDSLPHWQHVILPRVVYALCTSTVVVCVVAPFAKSQSRNIEGQKSLVKDSKEKQQTQNEDRLKQNGSKEVKIRKRRITTNTSMCDNDLNSDQVGSKISKSTVPAPFLIIITLLVAVWLPIALVLNDGVVLSAVLLALQLLLIVSALSQSQGTCAVHCVCMLYRTNVTSNLHKLILCISSNVHTCHHTDIYI